jgi:PBP superfamily domain
MSGHHARPGLRPRHTPPPRPLGHHRRHRPARHRRVWQHDHHRQPHHVGGGRTQPGPGGHRPTLTGAGSTFDAPFSAVAFAKYQQLHPGVTISYAVVGSSAGIAAISAQQVDFGAADVPMTAAEQAAAKGGPITQVPVDLGGEGIAYNLSLPAGARLQHRPRAGVQAGAECLELGELFLCRDVPGPGKPGPGEPAERTSWPVRVKDGPFPFPYPGGECDIRATFSPRGAGTMVSCSAGSS